MLTILKESRNEVPEVPLRVNPNPKEEGGSSAKKSGGVEDHVLLLQESISTLYDKSEPTEWDDKYKQLVEVLAEKNLMNFMAGVDICSAFLGKAMQFRRDIVESHLIELLQPILTKYVIGPKKSIESTRRTNA